MTWSNLFNSAIWKLGAVVGAVGFGIGTGIHEGGPFAFILGMTCFLAFLWWMVARDARMTCPHCGENVMARANVCPHCTRDIYALQR